MQIEIFEILFLLLRAEQPHTQCWHNNGRQRATLSFIWTDVHLTTVRFLGVFLLDVPLWPDTLDWLFFFTEPVLTFCSIEQSTWKHTKNYSDCAFYHWLYVMLCLCFVLFVQFVCCVLVFDISVQQNCCGEVRNNVNRAVWTEVT